MITKVDDTAKKPSTFAIIPRFSFGNWCEKREAENAHFDVLFAPLAPLQATIYKVAFLFSRALFTRKSWGNRES